MKATVEISMYPLKREYEEAILEFIADLKEVPGLRIKVNETSTHVFGEDDVIFDALKEGIRSAWTKYDKTVFVMKVLGADLEGSADDL